jgi:hypothetical protein
VVRVPGGERRVEPGGLFLGVVFGADLQGSGRGSRRADLPGGRGVLAITTQLSSRPVPTGRRDDTHQGIPSARTIET